MLDGCYPSGPSRLTTSHPSKLGRKVRKLVNGRTVLPLVININSYCGILFFFLKFVKFEKKITVLLTLDVIAFSFF